MLQGDAPEGSAQQGGVNLDVVRNDDDPTTFFRDGVRKIDFVLVYEENVKDLQQQTLDQTQLQLEEQDTK